MFEVYATRWDRAGVIAHLIPARGLSFSMPLSDHGEASFSATVEPGRSFWRSSLGGPRSGVLIAESQVSGPSIPVWAGRLKNESEQAERTFSFNCQEWGSALDWFPAIEDTWTGVRDTEMWLDILARVQAIPGQDLGIIPAPHTPGTAVSNRTVEPWDNRTAGSVLAEMTSAEGGPDWYVTIGGTKKNPQRLAVVGDQLGDREGRTLLHYVEDTADAPVPSSSPSSVRLLSALFPGQGPVMSSGQIGRRGGNVLSCLRTQDSDKSATAYREIGEGQEKAQIRETVVSDSLVDAGWPLITRFADRSTVTKRETLRRHGRADLAASAGVSTGYALVTQGSRPDWRKVPRGSVVQAVLDTDRYAGPRPLRMTPRLLNMTVAVPDDGGLEQVRWDIAETLEV